MPIIFYRIQASLRGTDGSMLPQASPLSVSVTYWKPYVETLAKKKKAERSQTIILPQTDGDPV